MDAVSTVRRLPDRTKASPPVQNAVDIKVDGYPGKISREQHVGHVFVPVGVAALLREYPTLVAPAAHAFCKRDNKDNKVLRMMRHFPPETRVMTAVRFSKALYAQLASQRYIPDVRTGWDLPPTTQSEFKAHDIGMKLACGFEMLVCSAGGVTPVSTPVSTPSDPSTPDLAAQLELNSNPRWIKYKQSLADKGYFRGELAGSQLYKELEERARQFFVSNIMSAKGAEENEDMLSAGAIIIRLLGKANVDFEFYKERATRLVPADDDSWLQITPDALDDLLETKYGVSNGNGAPKAAGEKEMMNSLSAFLGHMSDLEGAEVPQDLQDRIRKLSTLSTRKNSKGRKVSGLMPHPQVRKISSQSNSSNSSEMSSLSNKVDFNAESFTEAITNILEFGVPEDDYWNQSEDESSGMSSYGEEDTGDGNLSRKSSNTSQKSASSTFSATSSGVDLQMREYLKEMERELAATNLRDNLASKQKSDDDEADDEFDDVEDFEPVKVDLQAVQDLVKTYTAQNGMPGPASSLLGSIGLKPGKK